MLALRHRRLVACVGAVCALAAPARAVAQGAEAGTESKPDDVRRAEAKRLFQKGLALLDAGDFERAGELFVRSHALAPTKGNTANAALCLQKTGRLDEAIEFYEEMLTDHGHKLDAQERRTVETATRWLRERLGNAEISANVDGLVVIDGRPRGQLPLASSIRVLPGSHRLRISKSGFETHESTFEIRAGERIQLDAKLEPLTSSGQLRVEAVGLSDAVVFVDGARVGLAPWEGILSAGPHAVWIDGGAVGTGPSPARVVAGQTTLLRLDPVPLGARVVVRVTPSTAELSVGGTRVGQGEWVGRLPIGAHRVTATEPGYRDAAEQLVISPDGLPREVTLPLAVDRDHPRWPRAETSFGPWLALFGGYAGATSLHSDASAACPERCVGDPSAHGGLLGLRAGLRMPFEASVEVMGGYLGVVSTFSRQLSNAFQGDELVYDLDEEHSLSGPFVGGALSYRILLGDFRLIARTGVGVMFATSSAPIAGSVSTSTSSGTVGVTDNNQELSSTPVFVTPEVELGTHLGPVDVGVALAMGVFFGSGPAYDHEALGATDRRCDVGDPTAVGCAPYSDAVAGERSYDTFVLLMPQLTLGYAF